MGAIKQAGSQFLASLGSDLQLVEQAAAVTQGRCVIEQPGDALAASIENGTPIGCKYVGHLGQEPDDAVRQLLRGGRRHSVEFVLGLGGHCMHGDPG